jgi:hypothetical protein
MVYNLVSHNGFECPFFFLENSKKYSSMIMKIYPGQDIVDRKHVIHVFTIYCSVSTDKVIYRPLSFGHLVWLWVHGDGITEHFNFLRP